jgi:hypothetical protein
MKRGDSNVLPSIEDNPGMPPTPAKRFHIFLSKSGNPLSGRFKHFLVEVRGKTISLVTVFRPRKTGLKINKLVRRLLLACVRSASNCDKFARFGCNYLGENGHEGSLLKSAFCAQTTLAYWQGVQYRSDRHLGVGLAVLLPPRMTTWG